MTSKDLQGLLRTPKHFPGPPRTSQDLPRGSWEVLDGSWMDLVSLGRSCEYMKSPGKTWEFVGGPWRTWEVLGGHVSI